MHWAGVIRGGMSLWKVADSFVGSRQKVQGGNSSASNSLALNV